MADGQIVPLAFLLGLQQLLGLQERILPVPQVQLDHRIGQRILILDFHRFRHWRGAKKQSPAVLAEKRRAGLGNPPVFRDTPGFGIGHQTGRPTAGRPQVQGPRRLVGLVIVPIGEKGQLFPVIGPHGSPVMAPAGQQTAE